MDSHRAGRINRYGKLGNSGEGLVEVFLAEGDQPYDSGMLKSSEELIRQNAHTISSEVNYIRLTNEFYDQSWQTAKMQKKALKEFGP